MGIKESLSTLNDNLNRFRVPDGEASGRFFSSVGDTGEQIQNVATTTFQPIGLPDPPGDGNGNGNPWRFLGLKMFVAIAALIAINAFAGGAGEGIVR